MSERPPTVFISYSYDSPEHEKWVLDFAALLRSNGIESILDKWHFRLGKPSAMDMNSAIAMSERVLCICTDSYNQRVDEGKGGAGYEGCLITAVLVRDAGTDKFIPVVRNISGSKMTPTCLDGRGRVDLTDGDTYESELERLLRDLHDAVEVPPVGPNPYLTSESAPSGPFAPLMAAAKQPSDLYGEATRMIQSGDSMGFHHLEIAVRAGIPEELRKWRKKHEKISHPNDQEWFLAVDEAIGVVTPAYIMELLRVTNKGLLGGSRSTFLEDLLDLPGWDVSGLNVYAEIPYTCGYVFQCLYGAMCLSQKDLAPAIAFVDRKLIEPDGTLTGPVWQHPQLMGWPESLRGNCRTAWEYIVEAPKRWDWIETAFGSVDDFLVCLVAYFMALNVHELAYHVYRNATVQNISELSIPLEFAMVPDPPLRRKALRHLASSSGLASIWDSQGVDFARISVAWEDWMNVCGTWLRAIRGNHQTNVPHQNLLNMIS